MKQDWDEAIAFVFKMEGGWGNDPNDSGGETIFGISRNNWPSWDGWAIVDSLKGGKDFPMNANTYDVLIQKAKDFYAINFWPQCHCDDLPRALAIATFDCGVNQDPKEARRILQMALGVTVDGNIGAVTIAAAAKSGKPEVVRFLGERLANYMRIMAAKPKDAVFALDWSMRVMRLAELVLQ